MKLVAVLAETSGRSHSKGNSICHDTHNNSCWYSPSVHVVKSFKSNSTEACCEACDAEATCVAFTMNFGNDVCYLKDGLEIQPHLGDCISGGVILPPVPAPPPPPLPPSPPGA